MAEVTTSDVKIALGLLDDNGQPKKGRLSAEDETRYLADNPRDTIVKGVGRSPAPRRTPREYAIDVAAVAEAFATHPELPKMLAELTALTEKRDALAAKVQAALS